MKHQNQKLYDFLNINENPFPKIILKDLLNDESLSYVKIYHDNCKVKGIIYCNSLTDLFEVTQLQYYESFSFIEVSYKNNKWFRFVMVDESSQIRFQRDIPKFNNGWEIFFNSADNIVLHDPKFPKNSNHQYLKNNNLYQGVNFYVGIVALIIKVRNTLKTDFMELKQELIEDAIYLRNTFPNISTK